MQKQRLAILFGGVSLEHEVSIITGLQALRHADPEKYIPVPIYVDKAGKWWTGDVVGTQEFYRAGHNADAAAHATPFSLALGGQNDIDVALLCFHGGAGENGSVQGALELTGIPYQGPGVAASAVCFDKIFTRQILHAEGIAQPAFLWFSPSEYDEDPSHILTRIESEIQFPCFIKAANSGSSIGVQRIEDRAELEKSLAQLRLYDDRILVEAEVRECIEVNLSVRGTSAQSVVSSTEQPLKSSELLTFADKYQGNGKGKGGKKSGMASASRRIPAPITLQLEEELKTVAQRIFHSLDCEGVVRIDFFVNPSTREYFVIEVNTIPGSLSYYLWQAEGTDFRALIDELVAIALERQQAGARLVTTFSNNLLEQLS